MTERERYTFKNTVAVIMLFLFIMGMFLILESSSVNLAFMIGAVMLFSCISIGILWVMWKFAGGLSKAVDGVTNGHD